MKNIVERVNLDNWKKVKLSNASSLLKFKWFECSDIEFIVNFPGTKCTRGGLTSRDKWAFCRRLDNFCKSHYEVRENCCRTCRFRAGIIPPKWGACSLCYTLLYMKDTKNTPNAQKLCCKETLCALSECWWSIDKKL